jgi:hypothetical protein
MQAPTPLVHVFDSVDAIYPPGADFLGVYMDGANTSRNLSKAHAAYPRAHCIQITTTGRPGVAVSDGERGDLGVAEQAHWAWLEVQAGRTPTCYRQASGVSDLRSELAHYNLDFGPRVLLWVALWDDDPTLPALPGVVAKQYASGATWDTSIALATWPALWGEAWAPPSLRTHGAVNTYQP